MSTTTDTRRLRWVFGLVFGLLAAAILSAGFFAYSHYERNYRREVERTLGAIARLKVDQLVEYRAERIADGGLLFKNDALTALVRRFFADAADADARTQLEDWMKKFQANYQYDQARLMDAQGVTRLLVPAQSDGTSSFMAQRAPEVLRAGQVTLQDFFRDETNQRVYLALMVPILDASSSNRPLGVLVLRMDPAVRVYPLLQRWPTASETAETLLVRREGNEAVFLNELRFATNAPLTRRISLARQEVPAVRATTGHRGLMEGVDYRGKAVVAWLSEVPGSPWAMVARMDTQEVYAPLRERRWMVVGAIAGLILLTGSSLRRLWWHQTREALRQREEEFRLVLENSNDAIFWADAGTGCILRCNRKTEELTERTRDELIGMHVELLHPPGPDYRAVFRRLAAVPSTEDVETEFISRTGKRTSVVVNFTVVNLGRETIVQGIGRDVTERKRTELALRLSEEQRRLALQGGNLGTWDYNLVTGLVYWDERCRAICGVTADEQIEFSRALTLIHEADRPAVERALQEAIRPAGGGVYASEHRLTRADGTLCWVAASGRVYFEGEGESRQPVRFIGTVSDITERKQAEEALRLREEELSLVRENSNDAIFWADAETGIIVYANRKAEELTGRSRAQLIGMHQRHLHPPKSGHTELFRKVASVPNAENVEAEVQTAGGRRIPVLINSAAITAGRRRILQGIFRDITERKLAEEHMRRAHDELELRIRERTTELQQTNRSLQREIEIRRQTEQRLVEAELRYRTVADFTHDWEYWETPESRLEYCSPSCERITGYSAEAFIADPRLLDRIVHPDDEALWRNHRATSLAAATPSVLEFRICRKDGRVSWLEHVWQRVVGKGGSFLGVRASNRDITDRKATELETQRLREELAHMARLTTVGQMAATLAHELRQPLTGIACNTQAAEQLLGQHPPDLEEVNAALRDIRADGERAAGVIRNLRAMFQKTSRQQSALQLNHLLQETIHLLRSEFISRGTSVKLGLAPDLPRVLGNPIELQQVALNLIMNALEAMAAVPPPKRGLCVTTRSESAEMIRVSVADSGPGIPEGQFDQLFKPFYSTKPEGMGMGLSICRSLIEEHGGRLWAVNNPAGGATVHFSLPVVSKGHA